MRGSDPRVNRKQLAVQFCFWPHPRVSRLSRAITWPDPWAFHHLLTDLTRPARFENILVPPDPIRPVSFWTTSWPDPTRPDPSHFEHLSIPPAGRVMTREQRWLFLRDEPCFWHPDVTPSNVRLPGPLFCPYVRPRAPTAYSTMLCPPPMVCWSRWKRRLRRAPPTQYRTSQEARRDTASTYRRRAMRTIASAASRLSLRGLRTIGRRGTNLPWQRQLRVFQTGTTSLEMRLTQSARSCSHLTQGSPYQGTRTPSTSTSVSCGWRSSSRSVSSCQRGAFCGSPSVWGLQAGLTWSSPSSTCTTSAEMSKPAWSQWKKKTPRQERGESTWQRVGFYRLRTRVSSNRQARQPPSPLEAATLRRERRWRRFCCTTDSFARRRTLSGTPRLERVVYCVDSELVDILAL